LRKECGVLPLLCALTLWTAADGINHFEASPGPQNFVSENAPAVLPNLEPAAWLVLSYAHDPLVFRDKNGKLVQKIVEHEVDAELAASLGLFDRFEIGLVAPAAWVNGPGFDGKGLNQLTPGDIRANAKVLLTPWNQGVVASFRLQSDLIPIAQLNHAAGALVGEKIPDITPAFSVGYSSNAFRIGVDLGMLIREPTTIGDVKDALNVGSELTYGGGAEVTILPNTLFVTAEATGRVSPTFLGSSHNEYPLEANLALKWFTGPIVLMVGTGTGLVPDYGSPDVRAFAAIGFYQRDNDRDKDGIPDDEDACPDVPGIKENHGCPDVDSDGDGIPDRLDKCPHEPEDKDGWQDADGCPDPDNDGDGIPDEKDECPNDPETFNGYKDDDGCPDQIDKPALVVVKREKIEINDKIFFAYDSDLILPKSYELLDAVAKVIDEHKEIPAIFIEGHTDSDGPDDYNMQLSDRRAKSVMRYLVEKGVEQSRLKAKGFGETQPIAPNDSEENKAKNRRVEFKIVQLDDDKAKPPEEAPKSEDKSKPSDKSKPEKAKTPSDDLP
jgi:outer membrane protein OmpA-like peptidoglycan-associated protein